MTFKVRRWRGRAIIRVKVYVGRRLVASFRGRSLRSVTIPGIPGTRRHRVQIYEYTRHGLARKVTKRVWGCRHRSRAGRRYR
jgi:hypothetical protein